MKRRSLRQICTDAFRLLLNDIKSAKWAIALVIAYFVFGRKILHSMCPMVVLTGFPCPACGLTRAGCAMLGLDFKGAWQLHPFIYPIAALLVCWCAGRYILKKQKMPALVWAAIVTLSCMIAFYMFRMATEFPGEPPMSYYKYNMIQRAIHLLQLQK